MITFQTAWQEFVDAFTGALLQQSKDSAIDYNMAKIILEDKKMTFLDPTDTSGAWLSQLEKSDPQKGDLVRNILTNEMTISKVDVSQLPSSLKGYVPAVGAVAGAVVAHSLHASTLVTTISAVGPALVLYPTTIAILSRRMEANKQKTMIAYIAQLDKYRKSVESILNV